MKKQKNNSGFSLIELIIVIAILAILTGILAPAYIRYIGKSKRTASITECQQCVQAAQVLLVEKSMTSGNNGRSTGDVYFTEPYEDILAIANVEGEIQEIRISDDGHKVTYMRYLSSQKLVVIYENGEYRIDGESDGDSAEDGSGGESAGSITLTDSEGKQRTLVPANPDAFAAVKAALIQKGEYTFTSGLFQDDTGMYYVNNGPYYKPKGIAAADVTLADIAADNPGKWIKLSDNAKLLGEQDASNNGQYWKPGVVSKGDVCSYKGNYYIAVKDQPNGFWETPTEWGGTWNKLDVVEK